MLPTVLLAFVIAIVATTAIMSVLATLATLIPSLVMIAVFLVIFFTVLCFLGMRRIGQQISQELEPKDGDQR